MPIDPELLPKISPGAGLSQLTAKVVPGVAVTAWADEPKANIDASTDNPRKSRLTVIAVTSMNPSPGRNRHPV
jgi:hypothetical protein